MHYTLPAPSLNLHENMSPPPAHHSAPHAPDFPGVYIAGFLQQQRVFARVLLPGGQGEGEGGSEGGGGGRYAAAADVVVFPTDWREQRRIVIALIQPVALSAVRSVRASLPDSPPYFISDSSSSTLAGFHVPSSGAAAAAALPADVEPFMSWTLHDVRGGSLLASFSTPTQPPIL
jgi:hypothetical protein